MRDDRRTWCWLASGLRLMASVLGGLVIGAVSASVTSANGLVVALAINVLVGFVLVGVKAASSTVTTVVGATLIAGATAGLVMNPGVAQAMVAVAESSMFAMCVAAPLLLMATRRQQRAHLRRGWELAQAEAREQEAHIERAVTRERELMAGEIHDGLGHRLTLIAVQAGQLCLNDELPQHQREQIKAIRQNAADASSELGDTVHLMTASRRDVTPSLRGLDLHDVAARARSFGLDVRDDIPGDIDDMTGSYTRAALLRTLQEALTNAAKHAQGPVYVTVTVLADRVELQTRNAAAIDSQPDSHSGNGLVALRHRVAILHGTLDIDSQDDFTLTVRLPLHASPSENIEWQHSVRSATVAAEHAHSSGQRRATVRSAWALVIALLALLVVTPLSYYLYATYASALPPEEFARIDVGQSQAAAEQILPGVEMPNPPLVSHPAGSQCRFYESAVNFFDRDEVYQICFADSVVIATETIAPP